jgi:excisionase family DNA binding protein
MVELLDEWIAVEEGAALTGYHVKRVRELARAGRIRARKLGRRTWLIHRPSLLEYAAHMAELGTKRHDPWREDLAERGQGRRKPGQ